MYDYFIDVFDIDVFVDSYIVGGVNVIYYCDLFSEYVFLYLLLVLMMFCWFIDWFVGKLLIDYCVWIMWLIIFNLMIYVGMVRLVVIVVKVIIGRKLSCCLF